MSGASSLRRAEPRPAGGKVPAVLTVLTVLTVSLIGDWLRHLLDPTLRNLR